MNIRRLIAVWSAKLITVGCKVIGKQGATLAGKMAISIYPPILKELAAEVKKDIFVVCGTNGKTTTNNILCSVLEANNNRVICNHTGSNMLNGVISAFVLNAGLNGHLNADYACIEVDEASTVRVFPHFKPDYMVLTNLFRDQLDRYGEIDTTMNLLSRAMEMAPDMHVLVNGDDSLSTYLVTQSKNPWSTYGIGEQVLEEQNKMKSVKAVSANAAVKKWNTISIITASSEIIIAHTADLNDRMLILMPAILICPMVLHLTSAISISKPTTADSIISIISWQYTAQLHLQKFLWTTLMMFLAHIHRSSDAMNCLKSTEPGLC